MSGFKEMLAADNLRVFLNPAEFAQLRTVLYEGQRYEDIPVVLSGLKEDDRAQKADDHAQGLFLLKALLQCSLADLGGVQPQKGAAAVSSANFISVKQFVNMGCCVWNWRI